MNVGRAELARTAVGPGQFPSGGLPEIAFAGKSNVGKSSLINAVLGRRSLARTSGTPGKTRTLNFYSVETVGSAESGGHRAAMLFVDLPGYGYAKVSKTEKAKWGGMVEGYLKGRAQLRRVFLLVDIRHEPGANDLMLLDWFSHFGLPVTVVATKSDKLNKGQLAKHLEMHRRALGLGRAPIAFSSKTKDGRAEIWAAILDSLREDAL